MPRTPDGKIKTYIPVGLSGKITQAVKRHDRTLYTSSYQISCIGASRNPKVIAGMACQGTQRPARGLSARRWRH